MPRIDLYDEHFLSLGKMLVAFQGLEATLSHGLLQLINIQIGTPGGHLASAAIFELSFGSLCRLTSALPSMFTDARLNDASPEAKRYVEEELISCKNAIVEGIKLASEVEQRRNQLIHSAWALNPRISLQEGELMRIKARTRAGVATIEFFTESPGDIDENTEKAKRSQELIKFALSSYHSLTQQFFVVHGEA